MMHLDLGTIAIIGLALHAGLGLVMAHTYHNRKTYPGFLSWTVAQLLWVVGNSLFFFRAFFGEIPSIVLSNPLVLLCALLVRNGMAEFYGYDRRKILYRVNVAVVVVGLAGIYWYRFAVNDLAVRVGFVSLSISLVVMSAGLEPLLLARRRYSMQRLLSAGLVLLALSGMLRALDAFTSLGLKEAFGQQDIFLKSLLLISMFVMVLEVYGFITLTNERMERELGAATERLRELANTDELTGLANRRHLVQAALRDLRLAQRYGRPVSFIIFDLDHFKSINDTYGHAAGDGVLTATAARCATVLRDTDTLARWGGEEFAVLLPETTLPEAVTLAERLREQFKKGPLGIKRKVQLTASFGVAQFDNETFDELASRADKALYQAKREGRDRVCSVSSAAA